MTQTVPVPLWLLILIVLFAAVTFASHFLFPSVRWFFRKRAERVIARLNERLARPIEPFKLAHRYDMIQRLIYDPEITHAVVAHAKAEGIPENVAFETARRYAREIVPGFSATAYFTIGTRIARWLSKTLYDVRVGRYDAERLAAIDPEAAVVFVMNHRSNMDYVLVTYLVSRASALSYAVGEWARIWPLSAMVRMMGAYFIRRHSRGLLYRRVLARYVQMSIEGGVTQALFPEGGLSLDGRLAEPKMGLLNYIVTDHDPEGRNVIFVPVALNYDRVLEDGILVAADAAGERRFRTRLGKLGVAFLGHVGSRLIGRFKGFGQAMVSFGTPLSLADFVAAHRGEPTESLAIELMARIAECIPVLPVPLVARAVLRGARGDEIASAIAADLALLDPARGLLPSGEGADHLAAAGIANLTKRKLLTPDGTPSTDAEPVLTFYAASIAHHFLPEPAERAPALARTRELAEQ